MNNEEKIRRIKYLTNLLNEASKAYYEENREIMPNKEYDDLYDELSDLEKQTHVVLANSPTQNVGFEAAKELVKERHAVPALSLDKTKDVQVLADFLGDQKGLLSWKLDGLTIVLTYENGELLKAVTRGNGEIGEVVTANARTFVNLPLHIPFQGRLILRGEAVIKYSDFERINRLIPEADSKYKNPRNLCSGSVRQLDPAITAGRSVNFFAFSLVSIDELPDFRNSNEEKYKWLSGQGFDVVPYKTVTAQTMDDAVKAYAKDIERFDVPSDGLVLLMDDIAYGDSLGRTAKFPRNSIAFKWKDETAQTTLNEVEWSTSRTGLMNPVAIFDPVELEGTTVTRASLHNVSIIESLELGLGDMIEVYKANMIIPQISQNFTRSGNLSVPKYCPACAAQSVLKDDNGIRTLYCSNQECPARKIKLFTDFVDRNAMNIEGISEETLEKFIGLGFIKEFADIYKLEDHRQAIVELPGFGDKSYENMIASIENSRSTQCYRVLNALGITGVGQQNAKMICRHFRDDFNSIRTAGMEELMEIDGIGNVLAGNIVSYFEKEQNKQIVDDLLEQLVLQKPDEETAVQALAGVTFVITGSLEIYENRDALKAEIESLGGKVAGSVSSKTSFLINNDITSNSSKNKKAKELGVPIITEQEYISRFRV